jgi:hypothetical protein
MGFTAWRTVLPCFSSCLALRGALDRDAQQPLCLLPPRLPERTRLFRRFVTHQDWTQGFWASPTVLGVIDT